MSTLEETERRIHSRRWAEECYEAAEDKTAFAERVLELSGIQQATTKTPEAMTDNQALVFERQLMPFGVHRDTMIKDVPLDYLTWLVDERPEFIDDLRRYLRSPRVQGELGGEE